MIGVGRELSIGVLCGLNSSIFTRLHIKLKSDNKMNVYFC